MHGVRVSLQQTTAAHEHINVLGLGNVLGVCNNFLVCTIFDKMLRYKYHFFHCIIYIEHTYYVPTLFIFGIVKYLSFKYQLMIINVS